MKTSAFKKFICPIDQKPLVQEKNSLRCDQSHVFDLAREGYCNLLLVQQKASLDPGDNKEMVAARRRFLDGEHFSAAADFLFKLIEEIAARSDKKSPLVIVDAGCGEGYYLNRIRELAEKSPHPANLALAGCDISKWAVKAAAKHCNQIAWAVAGNRQLPFAAGSVDLILSMFGYAAWESFAKAQPLGGRVILVDPGADHLRELRKIIYPTVNTGATPSLKKALECGYVLEREDILKFSIKLQQPSQIQDLLLMTPHAFRITQKAREKLTEFSSLTVSADLVFRVAKRGQSPKRDREKFPIDAAPPILRS